MKIGLILNFQPEEVDSLRSLLPDHEIIELNLKSNDIKRKLEDIDVLVGANASDEIIEASTKLKLFHVPWVGLDRINFDALQKKNVPICNSKWNDKIVAEYALTLLLAGLKKLVPVHNDFSKGSWKYRPSSSKMLFNANILLIGFGSIGHELAKLLKPFTTKIIALRNNPEQSTEEDRQLVKKIIGWDDYEREINQIDYIICSLPLTPQTNGIITSNRIFSMKKGTYLVNVGRGKTIDEKGLFEALQSKHLEWAGIDVWYNYITSKDKKPFFPSQYPFQDLDNILMSPHRAAVFADASSEVVWADIVYNIHALESNEPLRNQIDYEKRY